MSARLMQARTSHGNWTRFIRKERSLKIKSGSRFEIVFHCSFVDFSPHPRRKFLQLLSPSTTLGVKH